MLTIRQAQLAEIEAGLKRRFGRKLRRHLQAVLPDEYDSAALVERGLREAQRFGLTREKDIARFLEVTGLHVRGFPSESLPVPALAILLSYGQDPEIKLARYTAWAMSQSTQF